MPDALGPDARTAAARPRRRRMIAIVAVACAAWAVSAGVIVWRAVGHAETGEAALASLEDDLASVRSADDLRATLALAERRFDAAVDLVGSPLLAPARIVPVLGRQIRSFDALATSARSIAATGLQITADLDRAIDREGLSGPRRVEVTRTLARASADATRKLAGVDLGPATWLLPPLADKRDAAAADLARIRSTLETIDEVAAGLADLLHGPRRYVLLIANNAEMRNGSGMYLTAGSITFANGEWELGPLEWTREMELADPVEVTGELAEHWGWLAPGKDWRNVNLTPRFDVSAQLASRMWESLGDGAPDGVIALDAVALQAVLRATGPVTVDDRPISADDILQQVLHDQYVEFDGVDLSRREDLQERIARTALQALAEGKWEPLSLARELASAATGRHVLAWSSRPDDQRVWRAAGIDGTLADHSTLVAIQNRNGTKLDQFLEVDAALEVVERGSDVDELTLTLTMENTVPEGEPAYITGPHPESPVGEGVYFGMATVSLPGATTFAKIDGHDELPVAGRDGPSTILGVEVTIPRGETVEVVFRFELPVAERRMRIEPSARIPPIAWSAFGASWTDEAARDVQW